MREVIETGRTVELAIDAGCEKLGVDRGDADFEILSLPKKGLLGVFGTSLAKVRVFIPGEEPKAEPKKAEPKPQPNRPEERKPAAQVPRSERPAPVREKKKEERPRDILTDEQITSKEERAVAYLKSVLAELGLGESGVDLTRGDEGSILRVTGEGLGALIGRRGETLDSLQYLTALAANRGDDNYYRITVDCENYREKRISTLEGLAKRIAEKVVRTGRSQHLEPMNPFERRVIHAAVSEIEGATSSSIGEEPNRRVIISSKNRPQRSSDRSGPQRGGHGRSDRDRRSGPRRDSEKRYSEQPKPEGETATRANPPTEAEEFSLYSKIEL